MGMSSIIKDAFEAGWNKGKKHPASLGFVIQYLYSEHQICAPDDEAAPYTPEELKIMAQGILDKR